MAQLSNPILKVAFREQDYRDPGTTGGGGKPLVPVTPQLRLDLQARLQNARINLDRTFQCYPDFPAVMIMQLRENAIAKSHRPSQLIQESELITIGNAALGEILLSSTPQSLTNLNSVIANRKTKQIIANISAIQNFLPWDNSRALHPRIINDHDWVSSWLRRGNPFIVEMFLQPTLQLQDAAVRSILAIIDTLEGADAVVIADRSTPNYSIRFFTKQVQHAQILAQHPVVRSVSPAPEMEAVVDIVLMDEDHGPLPDHIIPLLEEQSNDDYSVVGVFDTGLDPQSEALAPWLFGRETFVLPPDTNYVHGTMVASTIVAARPLNGGDPRLPAVPVRVLDVAGMEIANANGDDLLDRLREVLRRHPSVKVWNLSLGTVDPAPTDQFSWFAHQIDQLADQFGVLFVISAGNCSSALHAWPIVVDSDQHRISSPADAVRAISVGSLAHRGNAATLVQNEDPSPFTRRGPGPVKTPKPDVVHYGGNCGPGLNMHGAGIHAVLPGDRLGMTMGTSFSAPMVAAQAAALWKTLEDRGAPGYPDLIKALLIHSAALGAPTRTHIEKRFYGAGRPGELVDTIFCDDSTFTLMFEVEVADRRKWTKAPYPIPPCLLNDEGKFKGEILITLVYSPPLNPNQGAEYVRANVDISFGSYKVDAANKIHVTGVVPMEKSGPSQDTYESALIENGYKWSPVKTFRQAFSRGKDISQWALQASITRRSGELIPPTRQKVVILVSLRALDGNTKVYQEGLRALQATNWVHLPLAQQVGLHL